MRRSIAVFVTALLVGAQVLLPAMPASGKAAGCGGKMACCAVREQCAPASGCAAHGAGLKAASAEGAANVRAAGCGHALPGVVAPTLDPALFTPVTIAIAAPASGPRSESRQGPPASIPQEPLSPPPRG